MTIAIRVKWSGNVICVVFAKTVIRARIGPTYDGRDCQVSFAPTLAGTDRPSNFGSAGNSSLPDAALDVHCGSPLRRVLRMCPGDKSSVSATMATAWCPLGIPEARDWK